MYYMLFTCDAGQWHPQFGDHDRVIVMMEKTDTYRRDHAASDIRIVRLPSAAQRHVVAACASL